MISVNKLGWKNRLDDILPKKCKSSRLTKNGFAEEFYSLIIVIIVIRSVLNDGNKCFPKIFQNEYFYKLVE